MERSGRRWGETDSKGTFHADRRACFHSGRPRQRRRARRRARMRRDPDLSPEPAGLATDEVRPRRLRGIQLGVRRLAARFGRHPCRLPDQHVQPRPRDQLEVARLARPRPPARRRDRRRRRRPPRRIAKRGPARRGSCEVRQARRRGAGRIGALSGAVREHGRHDRTARTRLRRAGDARRGGRRR